MIYTKQMLIAPVEKSVERLTGYGLTYGEMVLVSEDMVAKLCHSCQLNSNFLCNDCMVML